MRFTVSPNRTLNNTATVDSAPTLVWSDKLPTGGGTSYHRADDVFYKETCRRQSTALKPPPG